MARDRRVWQSERDMASGLRYDRWSVVMSHSGDYMASGIRVWGAGDRSGG